MPKITARIVQTVGIFIIVSLVAVGLVIGLVYFVSERAEQARREQAKEVAREQLDQTPSQPEETDDTTEQPADKDTSEETVNQPEGMSEEELPATGAADTLYQVGVVALVAFSTALYVGTRRQTV